MDTHYKPLMIDGRLTYIGVKGSLIRYNYTIHKWEAAKGKTKALISDRKYSNLMGSQKWKIQTDDINTELSVSFSTCNTSEFMCQDGQCISNAIKCNGIEDCIHGSDEIHCSLIRFPEAYNPNIPPLNSNGSAVVNASVRVYNILDVDEDKNRIKITFKIFFYWKDSRLDFQNLHLEKQRNQLSQKEINKIWTPELEIYDIDLLYRETNQAPIFLAAQLEESTEVAKNNVLINAIIHHGNQCVLSRKQTVR